MMGWVPLAAMLAGACFVSGEPGIGPSPLDVGEGLLGVAYDERSREVVLELEPVDLEVGAGHAVRQPRAGEATLPVGGWLRGYHVELIDAQGRAVPRAVIHHVNIMAPERRELFSPVMQRIGAVGRETEPVTLPRIFGYPVERGDRILVSAMLHNPTDEAYRGVRVRVRFQHTDGGWIDPIRVYPFYMDVTPPATVHAYDLPTGLSMQSWEGTPAVSGRIMAAGGHLHDHAVALRLEDMTDGKILYETKPVVDTTGAVVGMPQDLFLHRLGLQVRAGHRYRLTAIYRNDTGSVIAAGGMGALGGIMIPGRGEVWPAVDVTDPEYISDYEIRTTLTDPVDMVGAPAGHGKHRH